MNERPGGGRIVGGIFLILFGLCLTLLGGGCTAVFVLSWPQLRSGGGPPYATMPAFLLSVATLGAGIALVWFGIKLMTGRANKD